MTFLYCSQGHENQMGSRFCYQCGEKLAGLGGNGIYPGVILSDRYAIVRELGHGGFGRTYLAEDTNRFREPCVLKEFAPQLQEAEALQKAEELFEREAGVLYKLQHSQIPRFRELFRVTVQGKASLFLVQDYIEGQTYHALLEARRLQGYYFSEAEVTQLLLQILPVLGYIHASGVIHRDISPDNLIQRSTDGLPVLIDFGGVKRVAAVVASQFSEASYPSSQNRVPTRLGKAGYAPEEQMQSGAVFPHSDLYALAVTVLVLLTGKEPQDLIDSYNLTWNWRSEISLSPGLANVLDRMLARLPGDRYQSAYEVLQALNWGATDPVYATTPSTPHYPQPEKTLAVTPQAPVAGGVTPGITYAPTMPPATVQRSGSGFWRIPLLLLLLAGASGLGWWGARSWLSSQREQPTPKPTVTVTQAPVEPETTYSPEEQARKKALGERREALGIDYQFYIRLVNELFYEKYPAQQGRTLTEDPKDANLRADWDGIAAQLLDKLESLSPEARSRLGQYNPKSLEQAKADVNKLRLGSAALYDLADVKFFRLFPEQRERNFLEQPIGQVWQGIVADELKALQSGTALERIEFVAGTNGRQVNGTLQPGEGKAFTANLKKDQLLQLNLQAPDQSTLLSVYPPKAPPVLLEDSTEVRWSSKLPQTGYYEFVVVSTASKPIEYQLEITAADSSSPDNPPPLPSPEPTN
jgi:serine/threonine protein kinase, bacterial